MTQKAGRQPGGSDELGELTEDEKQEAEVCFVQFSPKRRRTNTILCPTPS